MLCSQYGEIAVSWAFFAGAYAAPAPGAGYDPVRYDGIAVMSAAGCVRLFFGEMFVSSSRFFAE